jgi:hypothetical protein
MKTSYIVLIIVAIILIAAGIGLAAFYTHKHVDQNKKKDSHIFAIAAGAVLALIGFIIIIVVIIKNSSNNKKLNDSEINPLADMEDMDTSMSPGRNMQPRQMYMQPQQQQYMQPQQQYMQPQQPMYGQGMISGIPGGYSQTQWNTPISGIPPMNMGFPSQFSS